MALAIGPTSPPDPAVAKNATTPRLVALPSDRPLTSESAEAASLAIDISSKANVRSVAQAERTASEGVSAVQSIDATLARVDGLMTRVLAFFETPATSLDDRGREELDRIYGEFRVEAASQLEDIRRARQHLATNLETLQDTVAKLGTERAKLSQTRNFLENDSAFEQAESARARIVREAAPSIRVQANEPPSAAHDLLRAKPSR